MDQVLSGATSKDHLREGHSILESQGYPRSAYLTASLGESSAGVAQVLVVGTSHIEIRSVDGEAYLDAGLREIRGVRAVTGSGLQIWVTPTSSSFGLRQRQWDHFLPDQDAEYLEEVWLTSTPFMQAGTQLIPRPWREEEYAYFVGRALTEASQCEVQIYYLLADLETLGLKISKPFRGQSGAGLADILDEVGQRSAAFWDLGQRYREWYNWRNLSAHGIRRTGSTGRPSQEVFKMNRKQKPDGLNKEFEIRDQDFGDLASMWHGFYCLGHDARSAALDLWRMSGNLEDKLATLPIPNTASPGQSFPAIRYADAQKLRK